MISESGFKSDLFVDNVGISYFGAIMIMNCELRQIRRIKKKKQAKVKEMKGGRNNGDDQVNL